MQRIESRDVFTASAFIGALFVPAGGGASYSFKGGYVPIGHLVENLLFYDRLLVSTDHESLGVLLSTVDPRQLQRLVDAGKLRFIMPLDSVYFRDGALSAYKDRMKIIERVEAFTSNTQRYWSEVLPSGTNRLMPVVDSGLMIPEVSDAAVAIAQDTASHVWWLYRSRTESIGKEDPLNWNVHDDAMEVSVARLASGLLAGAHVYAVDDQIGALIRAGMVREQLRAAGLVNPQSDTNKAIDSMHRLEGVPTVTEVISAEEWSDERVVDLILGDEAAALRAWVKANYEPGVDLRDAYFRKLKELPSQRIWTRVLRFGAVTAVSTVAAGTLSGNPLLAGAVGTAVGLVDVALGDTAVDRASQQYHPLSWVSEFRRHKTIDG